MPGRLYLMNQSLVFLNIILYSQINGLKNKNKIYLISVSILSIFVLQQTILANMFFNDLGFDINSDNLEYFLNLFLSFMFILWILPPIFVRFRLYPELNVSKYRQLPVTKADFALATAFLSTLGIGSLLVSVSIFSLSWQLESLSFINAIFLLIIMIMFYILSAFISYSIEKSIFRRWRYPSLYISILVLIVMLIAALLLFDVSENIRYQIYKFSPPGLVTNTIMSIFKSEYFYALKLSIFILIYVFLGCYLFYRTVNNDLNNPAPQIKRFKLNGGFKGTYFRWILNGLKLFVPDKQISLKLFIAKDFYYFTKSKKLQIWYALELFFALLAIKFSLDIDSQFMGATIIGACILGMFNIHIFMNIFAYEAKTIQNNFIYPISLREVFLSKNIVNTIINFFIFIFMAIVLFVVKNDQISWIRIIILLAIFLSSNLLSQGIGNIASIYYAMRVSFSQVTGLFNPYASIFIGILIYVMILIPVVLAINIMSSDFSYLIFSIIYFGTSIFTYQILQSFASRKLLKDRTILMRDLNI